MSNICYKFQYDDKIEDTVAIEIDPASYEIQTPETYTPPHWAKLSYKQCRNCTLSNTTYCPIAKNIAYLCSKLSTKKSYEAVKLSVITKDRIYISDTTMQKALGSLLGLIFSLSPCDKTSFLKPMGMFHLPVSNEMDTLTRTFSFYVLGKFFDYHDQKIDTIDLEDLSLSYKNLRIVNHDFASRIRSVSETDAHINALVLLDLLAQNVDFEQDVEFEKLKSVFNKRIL